MLRANYCFENWGNVLGAVRGNGVLPTFLDPLPRAIPMAAAADIGAAVAALLRGSAWTGRRVIDLASFDASSVAVANALGTVLGTTTRAYDAAMTPSPPAPGCGVVPRGLDAVTAGGAQ